MQSWRNTEIIGHLNVSSLTNQKKNMKNYERI